MKKISLCIAALLLSLQAGDLAQSDFLYGIDIDGSNQSSELTFGVPIHYYHTIRQVDRSDSRIFNQEGHELPFSIIEKNGKTYSKETADAQLALFPVRNRGIVTRSTMSSVKVSYDQGARITVYENRKMTPGDTPAFYILENRKVVNDSSFYLNELTFSWEQYSQTAMTPLRIETSNDLESWRQVSGRETISRLIYAGEKIERPSVTIPSTKARYIRISPNQENGFITVTSVKGSYSKSTISSKEQNWLALGEATEDTIKNSYIYQTGGLFSFNKLKLTPPSTGYLYKGTAFYRNSEKESWKKLTTFSQYEILSNGDTLRSSPVRLYKNSFRELKLEFTAPKVMDIAMAPKVSVGQIPEEIQFLARGTAPYVLAYGNDTLRTKPESYRALSKSTRVSIGSPKELGGNFDNIKSRSEEMEIPRKTLILWGVLGIGVLLVVAMAASLFKDMKQHKEKDNE